MTKVKKEDLMKRRNKTEAKLDTIKQSRPRELMPRPAFFRNRKKYDRNSAKASLRKLASD